MNSKISFFLCLVFSSVTSYAVTAYPYLQEVTQRDGKKINVQLKGDERISWAETADGYSILFNKSGFYEYAQPSINSEMILSGIRANNANQRTSTENKFLQKIPKHLVFSPVQTGIMQGMKNMRVKAQKKASSSSSSNFKMLCIMINFADYKFIKTKTDYENLFNQTGYNVDGATGSVKDYYAEDSYNKFNVTVDVAGIYTSKYPMAYYGESTDTTIDANSRALIEEAVYAADRDVNYADYDNDKDGYVDGVYVIFAGYGQESIPMVNNAIWSHSWEINPVVLDGKTVTRYSCSPELRGYRGVGMTRIGVICHELGHIIGIPDFYDTDGNVGGNFYGTGAWDLMGSGSWNNEGATPAHHNAFSKSFVMGWTSPTLLTSRQEITLQNSAQNNNSFYRIDTSTPKEYFLLENKQQVGFDESLPGHGLLIYHVNENIIDTTAEKNRINVNKYQGMYIVCANAAGNPPTTYGSINTASCPFPGLSCKTAFADNTTPNAYSWSGSPTKKPITFITENNTDKTVSFSFMGGDECVSPTTQASELTSSNITKTSMSIGWTRGNGDSVLVIARADSPVSELPANGTSYTANSKTNTGSKIGLDNYVVYKGTGNSVDLTELTNGTNYYFTIYEYSAASKCYLTPAYSASVKTLGMHPYCTASAQPTDILYEHISNVSLGSINNTSSRGTNGYEDFTSKSTIIQKGQSNLLQITIGHFSSADELIVWVDWNQDGDFDESGEQIFASTDNEFTSPKTVNIIPPVNALLGVTRMRIRLYDKISYPNLTPCGTSEFGEVEDYGLQVAEACTAPNVQATNLATSNITSSSITLNWTRGNGDSVLVVARLSNSLEATPAAISYKANNDFDKGQEIGLRNFVVYNGTGNTVTINGLSSGTSYNFSVYEYNANSYCYLSPSLSSNVSTIGLAPYCAAGAKAKGDFITQFELGSIKQVGDYMLNGYQDFTSLSTTLQIGVKTSAIVTTEEPSDIDNQVLIWADWNQDGDFDDVGENVNASSTDRYFVNPHKTSEFAPPANAKLGKTRLRVRCHIFSFQGNPLPCGDSFFGSVQDYTVNVTAAGTAPTVQASALNIINITNNGLTLNYTRGNGDAVLVVARETSAVNANPNGITYKSSEFGKGSEIGAGNFVVYNGSANTINVTGLASGKKYYFSVFEYNNATLTYLTPALTGNAITSGVAAYCTPISLSENQYISHVSMGSIDNPSDYGTAGYQDFTKLTTDVYQGQSTYASINFANPSKSDRVIIWADWNHDSNFEDADEEMYFSTNNLTNPLITASFKIPSTALVGLTRMRIKLLNILNYKNFYDGVIDLNTTPCGQTPDGEVEDYTLNVKDGKNALNQLYTSNLVKVYPNPVKNELHIETDEILSEGASVELINSTGRVVLKAKLTPTNVIQTSHLSQG
ncbi:MAG: M6 family metalloprotease domain-containing protein, partial [Paludibacter sp.]